MKHTTLILIGVALAALTACSRSDKPGSRYPGWHPGELDIHHIQTGGGESNFLIFPDGTSLLIDAGDYRYDKSAQAVPDTTRRPGEWIARYIQQVNPRKNQVDYLMISHFHNDHTGDCSKATEFKNGYALCGITQVGQQIRFKTALDRGWPNYDYPLPIDDPDVTNYRRFIDYQTRTNGLTPEAFQVGSHQQIRLRHDSARYPTFHVQNIAANGELWDGSRTTKYYDANPANLNIWPNENTKSLVLLLTYGNFRYYTGGDASGKLLDENDQEIDYEGKIGEACGEVDVCKVNHHGYLDAMNQTFVNHINATNYILPVWDYWHIQPAVMTRLAGHPTPGHTCRLFATHVPDALRHQYRDQPFMKQLMPETGHIIIKVQEGGREYKIYVLDDQNESKTIRAIYGPFQAKGVKQ